MKLALALAFAKPGAIAAKRVLWTFGLGLVVVTSCFEIVKAQPSSSIQGASEKPTPPVIDGPKRTQPGTTRGPCEVTSIPFTAFLPETESGFSGYTLTEHPVFWFYVPYKTSSISSGKFAIEDEEGNTFYRTSVKLPNTPGFVSISIPSTEKPLEKNKAYRWTFTLFCASQDSDQPPQVWHMGTVQRVDMPALDTQLKTANLEERINLYLKNKIWYDAPTDLAKIRESPQAWRNLLKAMGLEQLTQEAIGGSVVSIKK